MPVNVLSSTEVVQLLDLLECPSTFQKLSEQFRSVFSDPTDYFKVCSGLSQLLQGSDLLGGPAHELRAAFLIFYAFREGRPHENPFLSLLIKLLHPPESGPGSSPGSLARLGIQARWFLSLLLGSSPGDSERTQALLSMTAEEVLAKPAVECEAICDTSNLQVLLMEQLAELPSVDRIGISRVIPNPQTGDGVDPPDSLTAQTLRHNSAIELLTCSEANESFGPLFYRVPPPLHVGEDALTWIEPVSDYVDKMRPFWDESMCASSSAGSETKRLLARALKQALTPNQQTQLLADLKKEPRKIVQLGLTPSRLPDLVETNPAVAVEVLMMQRSDCGHLPEFYSALVNMELSLHSMEVVNQLTTATELPAEFIHQYVSNCIATCETIKDRYMQNRLVRLVCVFLSSLIRNRLIDVRELLIEVQAFCIEFSRIKEAASLFRLLKNVD